MPKKSTTDQSKARCPSCLEWVSHVRAVAIFVSKKTGMMFPYVLCDLCTVRSRVNPKVIFGNVEAYFDADIAEMDEEASPPQA